MSRPGSRPFRGYPRDHPFERPLQVGSLANRCLNCHPLLRGCNRPLAGWHSAFHLVQRVLSKGVRATLNHIRAQLLISPRAHEPLDRVLRDPRDLHEERTFLGQASVECAHDERRPLWLPRCLHLTVSPSVEDSSCSRPLDLRPPQQ